MKKIFTLVLTLAVFTLFITGCSNQNAQNSGANDINEPAIANEFPLTIDFINGAISENEISLQVREKQDMTVPEGFLQEAYILYGTDIDSMESFGTISYIWGDNGISTAFAVTVDKLKNTDITGEKLIETTMEIYGTFPKAINIADTVKKAMANGEIKEYSGEKPMDNKTFLCIEAAQAYFILDFAKQGEEYILRRCEIMDEIYFKNYVDRNAQAGWQWAKDLV